MFSICTYYINYYKKARWNMQTENREVCKDGNLEKMNLLFYSEQSGFYKYFQNIIEALLANFDEVIYYVTSDPQDEIFKEASDRITPVSV